MPYISKRTLHHKNRFIPKGGIVPADYKRLNEGIRRGWIVVSGDPAATPPPVKEPEATSLPPVVGDPDAGQLTVSTEVIAPDESPEYAYAEPSIDDLDYLNPMSKKSLKEKGIVRIRDLEGWDVEALDELRGIGVKLAERLLSDFAEYVEWKESFSEYSEIEDSFPEDEDAGSDKGSGESNEDEGTEDD